MSAEESRGGREGEKNNPGLKPKGWREKVMIASLKERINYVSLGGIELRAFL